MRNPICLGELERGRDFFYNGKRFTVSRNLGEAGVAVHSAAVRRVTVGDRTFEAVDRRAEVWSAGSPVEVES